MGITAGEQQSGGEVRDSDGRLIVVGLGGVAIGGGGGGSDPLSDGTPGGALPSKTLWIAGANGAVLQGLVADGSGRLRTVVEGTPAVSVSNFPATQPVSGTVAVSNFPGSQPVTGPLTDTQLRATPVPVSGTFFQGTQPVSGTVTANQGAAGAAAWKVDGSAVTQPVSGTVTIGAAPQVAVNNVETLADNAGFTDGTSKLFPAGFIFDDVAGTALTENDVAAARINANRASATVLEDGTTRGRYATIKAASTAPVAGDTAQVVAISPNSPQFGQPGAYFVRPRKLVTYKAAFRTATAGSGRRLSNTFGAVNTRKQYATIHHAASATKTVRLRAVRVTLDSAGAATFCVIDLIRITTAPATGNPAITPGIADNADGAAEVTCLALPTTAATEGAVYAQREWNFGGTTTAAAAAAPVLPQPKVDLLERYPFDDESKPLVIRAGVLEGWAVTVESSAATTVTGFVEIEFTEE